MRVALVAPGFSRDDSDWCIPAIAHLVRALSGTHEIEVFALRYPPDAGTTRAFGAQVHAFGGLATRGFRRVTLLARARAAIVRVTRARRFDLVHALWADEPGWLAVSTARRLGIPSVVSLLGGELVTFADIGYGAGLSVLNRLLVRRSLAAADLVTVGSRTLEAAASTTVGGGRLRLVPLGVDPDLFRPDGPASPGALEGSPRLLSVGSLVPVKDHATLLRAFKRVSAASPTCRLHIAGEGPLRAELERLAGHLGVADTVRFHGALPHDALPACYRAADLCVLPSRFESQGMVVLEAAACGRTTVGTGVGVLPEIVPPEQVVPVGDDGALARAVLGLVNDPARRAAAGEAARRTFLDGYSLRTCTDRLLGVYGESVRARRASR